MRKKSRRTGSVYCCEVINTRPGQAGSATATQRVPPPLSPGCGHPADPTPKTASRRELLSLNHLHGHLSVCLGPSQSNIPADLCAPGSLCTPRQTGIFSGVCSHSRKNSQMGITLPHGTGWMSFIYNAGQLCSWVLPPRGVQLWLFGFQHCCAVGLMTEKSGLWCEMQMEVTQILPGHQKGVLYFQQVILSPSWLKLVASLLPECLLKGQMCETELKLNPQRPQL